MTNPNDIFTVKTTHLKDRLGKLVPFTCAREKDALLLDEATPKEIVQKLTDVVPDTDEEALLFLLKLREMSVSDVVDMTIECPHCQMMNALQIEIGDFYNLDVDVIDGIPVCLSRLEQITSTETYESLPIAKINQIEETLSEYRTEILSLSTKKPCMRCGKSITIFIDPRDAISKVDLLGLYREYFELGAHLNYGKRDVDSMIPFERRIFIDMLKKTMQTPKA